MEKLCFAVINWLAGEGGGASCGKIRVIKYSSGNPNLPKARQSPKVTGIKLSQIQSVSSSHSLDFSMFRTHFSKSAIWASKMIWRYPPSTTAMSLKRVLIANANTSATGKSVITREWFSYIGSLMTEFSSVSVQNCRFLFHRFHLPILWIFCRFRIFCLFWSHSMILSNIICISFRRLFKFLDFMNLFCLSLTEYWSTFSINSTILSICSMSSILSILLTLTTITILPSSLVLSDFNDYVHYIDFCSNRHI